MDKIGGYEAMVNQFMKSASGVTYYYEGIYGNMSCGFPPSDSFHIFRGINSDYPWPGLVFGLTLLALYYFCNNQVISIVDSTQIHPGRDEVLDIWLCSFRIDNCSKKSSSKGCITQQSGMCNS